MTERNPYAAPHEGVELSGPRPASPSDAIAHAVERLAAHTEDPDRAADDLRIVGPRVRLVPLALAAILVLVTASAVALFGTHQLVVMLAITLSVLCCLFAAILLASDLSLVRRGAASAPEAALKSYLRAIQMGRSGYAWAALAPTAREQTVSVPSLGAVATTPGDHAMRSEAGAKAYFSSFARPSAGQMRQFSVRHLRLAKIEGEVATIDIELVFHSWPQWVAVVMALGFAVFKPLILVGAVLWLSTRKQHAARARKTLLRAPTGAWYLFDANLLEPARDAD